jgi:hypothetical protein
MNSAARPVPRRMPLLALVLAPILSLLAAPVVAAAQGGKPSTNDALPAGYEVGQSLVCDTQEQVELFADLFTGDVQTAISVVNQEEHNPSACGIVKIAFMRGDSHGTIRRGDTAFELVHILVVGVETDSGIRAVRPSAYFTLFEVKEYAI